MELNKIYNLDCISGMQKMDTGCVNMVLADLPYGTTQCAWDKRIPFEPLWEQYERVVKENGAVVLFSAQPFTTDLIASNRKMFRYEIVWEKTQPSGFLNAKKMPLRSHENILVFYKKAPVYNPQMQEVERKDIGRTRRNGTGSQQYNEYRRDDWSYTEKGKRYPRDIIKFSNWNGALFGKTDNHIKHPTAKPVTILEYLIRTYTNEGDTVLDNCSGSGSTAIACINTGRKYICFEKDTQFYNMSLQRISEKIKTHTNG